MEFDTHFALFIKEKRFLDNLADNTIQYYEECWIAYKKHCSTINKQELNNFVVGMREAGRTPGGCNTRIRGINSFLSWLYKNEIIKEPLKIKQLKVEQRVLNTFSDVQIRAIVNWKPKTFPQHRIHTLLCFLIDTGARINEALVLRVSDIDWDNMLIKLHGKGNKQRLVPMSMELRKMLHSFKKRHKSDYMFPARNGSRLRYDNMRRDFRLLCDKLGIENVEGCFHAFRRKFAKNYVKAGGNIFFLMKQLGHTSVEMSKKYIEADEDDLTAIHVKTSMLTKMKR